MADRVHSVPVHSGHIEFNRGMDLFSARLQAAAAAAAAAAARHPRSSAARDLGGWDGAELVGAAVGGHRISAATALSGRAGSSAVRDLGSGGGPEPSSGVEPNPIGVAVVTAHELCVAVAVLHRFGQEPDITANARSYVVCLLSELAVTSFLGPCKSYLRAQEITLPTLFSSALALVLHDPLTMWMARTKGIQSVAAVVWISDLAVAVMLATYVLASERLRKVVTGANDGRLATAPPAGRAELPEHAHASSGGATRSWSS
ncbi:protein DETOXIFICATION 51-like [Oryza brachyantha]|uniref:protein DETOXIFICATION 51-like n=1 Tax=Oryza brachyantha TaxID=4533 RepID=UPI001ADC0EFA|nr:protein DETOXIFICATION 51-like [Oryza brachyantha]